jgi:hypothetical protein
MPAVKGDHAGEGAQRRTRACTFSLICKHRTATS